MTMKTKNGRSRPSSHRRAWRGDRIVSETERVLAEAFAPQQIRVYRYNSASIRARIVDPVFKGKSIVEREKIVEPLVARLSDDAKADLTILLLLAPEETTKSLMNLEFEEPAASKL